MVQKVREVATSSQEMVQKVQQTVKKWFKRYKKEKATSSQEMVQKVQKVECGIDKEHQCPLPKKVEVPILDVNQLDSNSQKLIIVPHMTLHY